MPRRHWLPVVALTVLPLTACTTPSELGAHTRSALRLVAFDSCDELGRELRAATARNVGPVAQTRGLPGDARAFAADQAAAPAPAPAYSGTNVHEQGVDEPDLVKTDGRRIVTVAGSVLYVVDAATRTATGRLDLGLEFGGGAQLLLSGDRALVLASGGDHELLDRRMMPAATHSEILLVDLAGAPRVVSRYRGDGRIVDARQVGGVARVVLSSTPHIDYPFRGGSPDDQIQGNRKAIESASVDAWLPTWEVTTGGAKTSGRLDCGAVSRPATFSGTSMLRVLTFDPGAATLGDGSPVAVVSDGDIVYGTATSLYVANIFPLSSSASALPSPSALPPSPSSAFPSSPSDSTEIFRFALPAAGKPVYTASGTVPGRLLNQYAMSEFDGVLRVATTERAGRVSAVRTLREQGGKLSPVGEVGGLGQDEEIYSVRFAGPRAYVVTFRRTDPLYSLDLSDPARPRVTGELKITGYSAHLQPAGPDRLIGIGQEADATVEGSRTGTQVSLFDVADPAHPRRLAQTLVPGTASEAEYDPHAVLWWEPTGLLAVPLLGAAGGSTLVLKVTDSSLRQTGRLTPPGQDATAVRRALIIGDVLWTVSDSGLLAADPSTLDRLGWVALR